MVYNDRQNWPNFDQRLRDWLRHSARQKAWAPRTVELYRHLIEKHVEPRLGGLPLGKVNKETIAEFFAAWTGGSRTIQQVYFVLRAALQGAVDEDVLASNPIGKVPKHQYRQFRSLNKAEARRLLETATHTKHFVLVYLALTTGMRQGELFGLRWENVDFENRFLSVTNTLTRQDSNVVLRPPKGKRSRRIELADQDLDLLRNHREQQKRSGGSEWVFSDTEGNPLQRHNFLHRTWRKIVIEADLVPLRFHDLRHTSATLSLAAGVPVKVVQERLGHASAKMTLDVYAKAVPSLQRTVAEKMHGILGDWDTFGDTSAGSEEKNAVK